MGADLEVTRREGRVRLEQELLHRLGYIYLKLYIPREKNLLGMAILIWSKFLTRLRSSAF